jgi:hypothetical protein
MNEASETLRHKPELALQVRGKLPLQAVEQAAIEGDLGFHYELTFAGIQGPALLFGYSRGIKARWPEKQFRWLCGNAANQCWRQSLLLKSHRTVYFAEGEIDGLTLISQGYDIPSEALVVALPAAKILPAPEPFAGKEIVIVSDADEAGSGCAAKLKPLLLPIAKSVTVVNLAEEEASNGEA